MAPSLLQSHPSAQSYIRYEACMEYVACRPTPIKVLLPSAVSPAFAISNYLWISHLPNFGLRIRELTSLLMTPIYGQGWERMLACCTWNVTSLAALQNHHDKLAHIQVGRVKGFVLLRKLMLNRPPELLSTHTLILLPAIFRVTRQAVVACALPP